MRRSNDVENFRNEEYLQNMSIEFKRMFNAYHKYISYRNKLNNELTMSDEQKDIMSNIDKKFIRNIKRANDRIQKEDFIERN